MSSANRCKGLCQSRYGTKSYSKFVRWRGFLLWINRELDGPRLINCFDNRLTLKGKPRRLMLLSPGRYKLPLAQRCPTVTGTRTFFYSLRRHDCMTVNLSCRTNASISKWGLATISSGHTAKHPWLGDNNTTPNDEDLVCFYCLFVVRAFVCSGEKSSDSAPRYSIPIAKRQHTKGEILLQISNHEQMIVQRTVGGDETSGVPAPSVCS